METNITEEGPIIIPQHTKQAAQAMLLLLFFSLLMFTLPFAAYYGTKHVLLKEFHIDGFANTVWSVIAAVITVNLIIAIYAFIAYNEQEYDDRGRPVSSNVEVKED